MDHAVRRLLTPLYADRPLISKSAGCRPRVDQLAFAARKLRIGHRAVGFLAPENAWAQRSPRDGLGWENCRRHAGHRWRRIQRFASRGTLNCIGRRHNSGHNNARAMERYVHAGSQDHGNNECHRKRALTRSRRSIMISHECPSTSINENLPRAPAFNQRKCHLNQTKKSQLNLALGYEVVRSFTKRDGGAVSVCTDATVERFPVSMGWRGRQANCCDPGWRLFPHMSASAIEARAGSFRSEGSQQRQLIEYAADAAYRSRTCTFPLA